MNEAVAESQEVEKPYAVVKGEAMLSLPKDLYIPPDAMEVFLEAFQGPLDILLYLIKKQNIDILNIPIAKITAQYVAYVELMNKVNFEMAAEYLVMAAMLAEIKSRMLLPRVEVEEGDEEDPRAELVRRLQEYERFKQAAEDLEALPRLERDIFLANVDIDMQEIPKPVPDVNINELIQAINNVYKRADLNVNHHVEAEVLTMREKMSVLLDSLSTSDFTLFNKFLSKAEGSLGVVVTFSASLELLKQQMIELVQAEPYGQIHMKSAVSVNEKVLSDE